MGDSEQHKTIKFLRGLIGHAAARLAKWALEDLGRDNRALVPLTPKFEPGQHQAYVSYLTAALEYKSIRNIALTGRYGTGKSSVLQEFAREKRKRVLFLSLSTLGPDKAGESRTNDIEKELVKQLLHREKPARLPQSRYQRIGRIRRLRIHIESTAALAFLGLALWVVGAFPHLPGLSAEHPWWLRVGSAIGVSAAGVFVVSGARLVVRNRVISQVSAGGASISLSESSSYFDQYLDEIVYFFESMHELDIVVFEDLDRFDDPGIFEALRELNTLLNNSKQMGDRSIRFIYALRDSIFELLGVGTPAGQIDVANAEAVRANRTKFFDLVIPVVPFITHRNSRDLLSQLLGEYGMDRGTLAVGPELIDLTARHLPDMRLLKNIRNEYAVYAQRLIEEKRGVDSLSPDKLFALVVYKNTHLGDFERVLLGQSQLDTIYRLSRKIIDESITARRLRLRQIADATALDEVLAERAQSWGERLAWHIAKVGAAKDGRLVLRQYRVGTKIFEPDALYTDAFWRELVSRSDGVVAQLSHQTGAMPFEIALVAAEVRMLIGNSLPEEPEAEGWDGPEREQLAREEARLGADLLRLRTADFKDLAERADFHVQVDGRSRSFKALLAEHIWSEVGRALVTEGFVDRYYTLYAAQYYGDHVPPNALNFIVHNVDANHPDARYPLNDDEVSAVLRETNRSFLNDRSAYNFAVLDHLLRIADRGAHTILDHLVSRVGEEESSFLQTYFAESAEAPNAVKYLAGTWPSVFRAIVQGGGLTRSQRAQLTDVALANSRVDIDYDLDEKVREFFQDEYKSMPTIAKSHAGDDRGATDPGVGPDETAPADDQICRSVDTLSRAGFKCDSLEAMRPGAIRALVAKDCYTLGLANLRTALDDPESLSIDRIRGIDAQVYQYVLAHPKEYISALENNATGALEPDIKHGVGADSTRWTVEDPAAFVEVVNDFANFSKDQAAELISRANPDCIVGDLADVANTTWEALAQCKRFLPTLGNVEKFIEHMGEVDEDLAAILTASGSINVATELDGSAGEEPSGEDEIEARKADVAEAILKAARTVKDPEQRVRLAVSIDMRLPLPAARVPSEPGHLLGLLLAEGVCDDAVATFQAFDLNDWETLSYAIVRSTRFVDFMTPGLIGTDMVARILESPVISVDVRHAILERFDEFVPSDNRLALRAAGNAALIMAMPLLSAQISRIASGADQPNLVLRLVHEAGTALSAAEIVAILRLLPAPYDELANLGAKLTFSRDEQHAAVLKRLQQDGRITMRSYGRTLRKEPRIEVTVIGAD